MYETERHAGGENAAELPPESIRRKLAAVDAALPRRIRRSVAPLLPYYHCVSESAPPHLVHVQAPRHPAQFIRDLAVLRQFAGLRGASTDSMASSSGAAIPDHGIITFDDGLRDGLHFAVDLALEAGFTVVLFICPSFISNADLMYRHKASLLVTALDGGMVSKSVSMRLSGMLSERGVSGEDARVQLLRVRYDERSVLDDAAHMLSVDVEGYVRRSRPYLDADELRTFTRRGILLGSHGWDHAPVRGEHLAMCIGQINESFDQIRDIAPQEFRLFSYPFGDAGVSQHAIDSVMLRCGLDHSFGTAGWRPERNPRHKQRLRMEVPGSAGSIVAREMARNIVRSVIGRTVPRRRSEVSEVVNA